MSIFGEVVKFCLNKNWVVFALSLIGSFFVTIAIPMGWRNAIPFEKNDWKTIALYVVISAMLYVMLSGFIGLAKVIISKKKKHDYDNVKQALRRKELKDFLTTSPDKFYYLVEFLVNNSNPWVYVYVGMDYTDDYILNTVWFQIENAPEMKNMRKSDGEIHREKIDTGRRMLRLQDWLYRELVATKKKTGYLTHKHRGEDSYKWEIVKDRKENKK